MMDIYEELEKLFEYKFSPGLDIESIIISKDSELFTAIVTRVKLDDSDLPAVTKTIEASTIKILLERLVSET
jgi:hypothetical protein